MKKRLMSLGMAIVMLVSLSVSAFAAEERGTCGTVRGLTAEETEAIFNSREGEVIANSRTYMPRNVDGNQGNNCGSFTATTSEVAFRVKSVINGSASTYNVVMFEGVYPNGSVFCEYETSAIGNGVTFSDLRVGYDYYFVISSDDCTGNGVNVYYEVKAI